MIALGLLLAACQTTPQDAALSVAETSGPVVQDEPIISLREGPHATSGLASYLVGRYAIREKNVPRAAEEFAASLADHPLNTKLMQLAFSTYYINGDVDNAALLAGQLEQKGKSPTFGSEPSLIIAIEMRDFAGMLVLSDHIAADETTHPLGIIVGAWALIFQDQGDAGLTRLLELKSERLDGSEQVPFVVFSQAAMMNEYLGRAEDAVAAAMIAIDHPEANIAVVISMAGVLMRQGYQDKAYDILDKTLSQIFNKKEILENVTVGTSVLYARPDMDNLIAEAIMEASYVAREQHISSSARLLMATRLAGDNSRINYALGLYYQDIEQFENTLKYYDRIAEDSLWYQPSLFIKARYMSFDEEHRLLAKEIFDDLAEANPLSDVLWHQSADAARRRGDYAFALNAYDKAITLNPDIARLYYSKAVVLDKLERKSETEASLRQSLIANPDDAYALNYLGYWLLEEGGDAEEALGLIRKAIEKQPQNGYFMDSLGWGYFRLGQYRQAVLYLERAVSLEPQDPIITDHLGDAYAFMNRAREARYQWERALKFSPDDELKKIIMVKLKDGIKK